ncbi:MAG: glycosyltransferase family 2 protein [Thermoplasmatota archaeon]
MSPSLSVVLLTWNEEANIAACLASLGRQTRKDFEVIVVDAASTDRTVQAVLDTQPTLPFPLRLVVAETRISVGEARNRGVELAQAPNIAFLSADTEPSPHWADMAIRHLERADLVYGMQVHAPSEKGLGAAVRGLRYHFPSGAAFDPAKYASHVNAAIRREILVTFPIGTTPGASAVDDVLLVKRATKAGYRAAYEPRMAVLHRDVDSWRTELKKNRREGLGLGEHAGELGLQTQVLVWAVLMLGALAFFLLQPGLLSGIVLAFSAWLPTLRRAVRRARRMPAGRLMLGVLASPLFDLAFLLAYVRGLLRSSSGSNTSKESRGKPAPGREVSP